MLWERRVEHLRPGEQLRGKHELGVIAFLTPPQTAGLRKTC